MGNIMLEKVSNRILKYCYSKADAIIDIGPCMRRKILRFLPDKASFHTLTPWSFVEGRKFEEPHFETRKTLFRDSTLAIMYTGTIGNAHDFDSFLSLARRLRQLNANVGFCFAGFGSRYDELKSKVLIDDTNITFAGFVNSDLELEQRVSSADLMMVSLRPDWTGISVPSKFFTSIATAKPVLFAGASDSAISIWIKEYGLGFQVSTTNIDEIAYKLRDISLDQELIADLKERATRVYDERFSKKVVCDGWYNLLTNSL
jgi:glycosyltransferase involved in cell wall biosynthesis